MQKDPKKLRRLYKQWLGYVENSKIKGFKYDKGIKVLKDIVEELGDEELKQELEDYLKTLDKEIEKYKQKSKIKKLITYIENSSSLNNLVKNVHKLDFEVGGFKKLKDVIGMDLDSFKKIVEERVELHVDEKLKKKKISKDDVELIKRLVDWGIIEKDILEKVMEEYQKIYDVEYKKIEKVRKVLEEYLGENNLEIDNIIKNSKNVILKYVNPDEDYILFPQTDRQVYYVDIIKKKLEGIPLVQIHKDLDNFWKSTQTDFYWLIPEKYINIVDKIIDFDDHFEERIYNYLKQMRGIEEYTDPEDIFPLSWNHLKKQYVGILKPDLSIDFISKRGNFSSSGKNQDLIVDLDEIHDGDIVVVKSGSYKHLQTTLYRKEGNKYVELISQERKLSDVIHKIVNEIFDVEQ